MCLSAPKPRDRDRSPSPPPRRPARVTRHSAKSVSRYDDEHIIGSKSNARRPQYQYGPRGDIVGVDGEESDDSQTVRPKTHHLRASAPSTSRYDDEHIISSSRPYHQVTNQPNNYGMSNSVSEYDDEHVTSAPTRPRPAAKLELSGTAKSTWRYDEEDVFSSKSVGGKSSGAKGGGLMGMFSGESSHMSERRIGEKLVGSQYGPGKFLSGKSSMKPKRETKEGKSSGRPKEYGI